MTPNFFSGGNFQFSQIKETMKVFGKQIHLENLVKSKFTVFL